jgi:hypothetical protein
VPPPSSTSSTCAPAKRHVRTGCYRRHLSPVHSVEFNLLSCTGVGPHGAGNAFIKPRTIAIRSSYDVSLC